MRPVLVLGVALLALVSWSKSTLANDHYGAIAYSPTNGKYGYTYDYGTRASAEEAALRNCNDADCRLVLWFVNACGALAIGDGYAWGAGWASSQSEAENIAMSYCNREAQGCSIARWVCTSR